MSVIFDSKKFSDVEKERINKLLTFVPEEKNKNFKQKFFNVEIIKPVHMYTYEDGKVKLPFRFACNYYKKIFNDKEFPKLFEDKKDKFNGKLLERQKEPFKEAVDYLNKFRSVTIALYPGFGKTFMGVMMSYVVNMNVCVLVHRESVGKQWVKTFKTCLPDLKDDIWFVNDKIKENAKILVCMDGRIDKIPKKMIESIGCLIIDEAHCFCSHSRVKPLLSFSPKYVIAETATPIKDNGMHKMIQSICGLHYIRKISNKPYNFYILNTKLEFDVGQGKYGELVNAQCLSGPRNKIITNIINDNPNFKSIIISNRKEHCRTLKEKLEEFGIDSAELYGTIKNYKTKRVLIGTGSKMGVGFDEANFCDDFDGKPSNLLIMCYTIANWATFEQIRGRGMRAEKPNVIIFNDRNPMTKKHMTQIRKWVRETNGNIVELDCTKLKSYDFL